MNIISALMSNPAAFSVAVICCLFFCTRLVINDIGKRWFM